MLASFDFDKTINFVPCLTLKSAFVKASHMFRICAKQQAQIPSSSISSLCLFLVAPHTHRSMTTKGLVRSATTVFWLIDDWTFCPRCDDGLHWVLLTSISWNRSARARNVLHLNRSRSLWPNTSLSVRSGSFVQQFLDGLAPRSLGNDVLLSLLLRLHCKSAQSVVQQFTWAAIWFESLCRLFLHVSSRRGGQTERNKIGERSRVKINKTGEWAALTEREH